ncbi:MAG: hypothetical protein ACXVZX_14995 [Terriglobales bacterium]
MAFLFEPAFELDCAAAAFGSVVLLDEFWSLIWFGEEVEVPVVLVAEFWLLEAAPAAPAPVWSVAAPFGVVVAVESGVAVVLPLTPPVVPVVELFGCVELLWSLCVCGVVVLIFELLEFGEVEFALAPVVELLDCPVVFPVMLLLLPVPLASVVVCVAVVPPFCPVGVDGDGTALLSVWVLLFIDPTRSLLLVPVVVAEEPV